MIGTGRFAGWVLTAAACVLCGCATTNPDTAGLLRSAQQPAYSFKTTQDEMAVSASPVGKTLRFAGSTGLVVGASVDVVVNSKYRDQIRGALEGYSTSDVFAQHVKDQLSAALGGNVHEVAPTGSTAGFQTARDAEEAHRRALARQGHDTLLDLRARYGLYGTQAELVAELDAELVDLTRDDRVWDETFFAVPRPALASDRLGNPLGKKRSSESAPQFAVDDDAFARWTANGGEALRAAYEEAVAGVTAALLDDLGLTHTARGHYYLGRMALAREQFQQAEMYLSEALRLDPALTDAANARAVNFAEAGQLDEAIALAQQLTEANPDYAPAWYNLAWWYAIDRNDPAQAKPCYDRAIALGLRPDRKIEDALK